MDLQAAQVPDSCQLLKMYCVVLESMIGNIYSQLLINT